MSNDRELDVIIFGASGFTGKYTIYEGIKILDGLKWGIAGRNKPKLEQTLKEIGVKAKKDLSATPVVIADVTDEESLKKMASRCKVVVNTCGPYRFFGEAVVRACIEAGTHHVDVSGEPQYMERMQLEYNDLARKKGVYVISACGFDSIPADMGTIFLESKFDGVVNSVETYLESQLDNIKIGGAGIHYGTWESAVYGLAHADELKPLRNKLFKSKLPNFQPRLKSRMVIHKSTVANDRWSLPFPGSDRSVVMRSQRLMYENENKRPVQMRAYITFDSIFHIFGVLIIGVIFGILTRFSFGRKLLLAFPRLFTAGFISHEGPTEEMMQNTHFTMYFYGEGWSNNEKLIEPMDQYKTPPTKNIITKVTGTNPGYGATCVALLLSATTILNEKSKMPSTGGVLPPGAAFAKTNIINELCKNNFTFEVISTQDTKKINKQSL